MLSILSIPSIYLILPMILNKRIPLSYIVKSTGMDFVIISGFTAAIAIIQFYIEFFTFPVAFSTFLGTTIALVLSFNLSLSYDRWWEGRKIWGEIVNDSRALVLQLQSFTDASDSETVNKIAKLQIAWNYFLIAALRKNEVDSRAIEHIPKNNRQALQQTAHKPLFINALITDALKQLHSLNDYQKVQLDSTLVRLVASMGKSERIKNTVFPKEYQQVMHLSIYMFLGFMSISLENLTQHWEPLLLIFLATPLLFLEATAKHLQDPFDNRPTDVPIHSISRNIEINILSLLQADDIPEPAANNDFYIN